MPRRPEDKPESRNAHDDHRAVGSVFSVLTADEAGDSVARVLDGRAPTDQPGGPGVAWVALASDGRVVDVSPACPAAVQDLLVRTAAQAARPGVVLSPPPHLGLVWTLVPPPAPGHPSRRIYHLPRDLVFDLLEKANPQATLTPAEKMVVFRLLGGLSLRESAEADGLSLETKRNQLKSVLAKLECAGQVDLVRHAMTQLAAHLPTPLPTGEAEDLAEAYVARHLPPGCRYYRAPLGTGRMARVIEAGPPGGLPVVLVHGMLFPPLLAAGVEALHAARVRLIVPVRSGYFEIGPTRQLADAEGHAEAVVADLADFVERFVGAPAVVAGTSLGSSYAVELAARRPELLRRLVLLAADSLARDGRKAAHVNAFYSGLRNLVTRPGVLRRLAWQFTRTYANARVGRRVLMRMFRGCPVDAASLAIPSGETGFEWFRDAYATSFPGVAEDYRAGFGDWRERLGGVSTPIQVIHGEDDTLSALDTVLALVAPATPPPRIDVIPGAGHLVGVSHAARVWRLVAEADAADAALVRPAGAVE